jgi:hypothetical protein
MKPEEISSWSLTEMEEFENRTSAPKAFGAGRFNQQRRDRPTLGVIVLSEIGNAGLNSNITLTEGLLRPEEIASRRALAPRACRPKEQILSL